MTKMIMLDFEEFAECFVRCYWQDVKDHPDLEPVEESLQELLNNMTWKISSLFGTQKIKMKNTDGDKWSFSFRPENDYWKLTALSSNGKNLLAAPYDDYFLSMINRTVAATRVEIEEDL